MVKLIYFGSVGVLVMQYSKRPWVEGRYRPEAAHGHSLIHRLYDAKSPKIRAIKELIKTRPSNPPPPSSRGPSNY